MRCSMAGGGQADALIFDDALSMRWATPRQSPTEFRRRDGLAVSAGRRNTAAGSPFIALGPTAEVAVDSRLLARERRRPGMPPPASS